jgi:hypothetical protein
MSFVAAIGLLLPLVKTNGIAKRQSTGSSYGLSSSFPDTYLPCPALEHGSCQDVIGLYMARKAAHSCWLRALGLMLCHGERSPIIASIPGRLFAYRIRMLTLSIRVVSTDDGLKLMSNGWFVDRNDFKFVSYSVRQGASIPEVGASVSTTTDIIVDPMNTAMIKHRS